MKMKMIELKKLIALVEADTTDRDQSSAMERIADTVAAAMTSKAFAPTVSDIGITLWGPHHKVVKNEKIARAISALLELNGFDYSTPSLKKTLIKLGCSPEDVRASGFFYAAKD